MVLQNLRNWFGCKHKITLKLISFNFNNKELLLHLNDKHKRIKQVSICSLFLIYRINKRPPMLYSYFHSDWLEIRMKSFCRRLKLSYEKSNYA